MARLKIDLLHALCPTPEPTLFHFARASPPHLFVHVNGFAPTFVNHQFRFVRVLRSRLAPFVKGTSSSAELERHVTRTYSSVVAPPTISQGARVVVEGSSCAATLLAAICAPDSIIIIALTESLTLLFIALILVGAATNDLNRTRGMGCDRLRDRTEEHAVPACQTV